MSARSYIVDDREKKTFLLDREVLVSDDILRQIGTNRDWTKKYGVVSALVKNPRTPLGLAINFIPRMNPRDMKTISVDKNVSEVVRKQALKFVRSVGGGGDKKH